MTSVSEELRENDVLLVKVAPENYAASLVSVLGQLGRGGGRTCILLLSRPYSAIAKKLGRGGDYFFIAVGEVPNGLGVGVDSPGNLSDLGITFSTALGQKCSAARVGLAAVHPRRIQLGDALSLRPGGEGKGSRLENGFSCSAVRTSTQRSCIPSPTRSLH
ncbi:MAG: hypothetical protein QXH27_03965 [Candidatus Micrarchaeia archaeon]